MLRRKTALDVLEQDHEKVTGLLERLTHTTSRGVKTREKLLADIRRELEMHTTIEEEIFYPAFRRRAGDSHDEELYFEALEEHRLVGEVELPAMQEIDPSSAEFAAKASVLKELVRHHIEEERNGLFPRVEELFDEEELVELGERLTERKKALMQGKKAA